VPVVLATGYADLPSADDPGLPRLAKPYRREELAHLLTTLVGQESAPELLLMGEGQRA